ncbi:hypothetical protein FA13DRAFT_1913714 [Coprinellus micaceus]|uniref:Uncharacterized protein n=1 Tax=Coprinellus micaceus TaxID=71717 RepID=A0A4Y7SPP0_COPMI|nr:hypothetical protein FA13DRAFT_1913714 [Coprinellus micaceus]
MTLAFTLAWPIMHLYSGFVRFARCFAVLGVNTKVNNIWTCERDADSEKAKSGKRKAKGSRRNAQSRKQALDMGVCDERGRRWHQCSLEEEEEGDSAYESRRDRSWVQTWLLKGKQVASDAGGARRCSAQREVGAVSTSHDAREQPSHTVQRQQEINIRRKLAVTARLRNPAQECKRTQLTPFPQSSLGASSLASAYPNPLLLTLKVLPYSLRSGSALGRGRRSFQPFVASPVQREEDFALRRFLVEQWMVSIRRVREIAEKERARLEDKLADPIGGERERSCTVSNRGLVVGQPLIAPSRRIRMGAGRLQPPTARPLVSIA